MCGLVGLVARGHRGFRPDPAVLARMAQSVAHRGPDGGGMWFDEDGRAGLALRRLAVIDLSAAANQPMPGSDGKSCLVFNGEIYNFRQLRTDSELCGAGPWKTDHSDTEVLLRAFEVWGLQCVDRLEGMFAFAFWDGGKKELWLVRDRIGVKPLYIAVAADHLAFASEIKALLISGPRRPAVDEEALFHYLSFLVAPAPMTMFAGIQKLPAGGWLRLASDGRVETGRWWDPLDHVVARPGVTPREAREVVLAEVQRAVRLREVSDVPVGVFLSGGVDSSANTVLFARDGGAPLQTFTVGYAGDPASAPSEVRFAREVSTLVGAQHHQVLLGVEELMQFLPEMARAQDEPLADPVCFPLYYLARLARESGVPVVQVGEGADEIFAGYPRWHQLVRAQKWATAVPKGKAGEAVLRLSAPFLGTGTFRYEYLRRAAVGVPVFWGGAEGFGEEQKKRLLGPAVRQRFAAATSWDVLSPLREAYLQKASEPSALGWMTYLDLRLRLPELLLMRVDKMTMAWGVEAREPFLDPRLVTTVMGFPARLVLGEEPKALLKEAMTGVLPSTILQRRKQGFGVPVREWMDGPLGTVASSKLTKFCRETELLDLEAVRALMRGRRREQAWYLLNLALWWERWS